MIGKILKVSNNDLNGNVDDRLVAVYAAFNHKKYMNRYAIFSFLDEYANKKLYVGSVHLKNDSLVTFSIRDDEFNYTNKFIEDFMNQKLDSKEYEIIDISKMEKIELVSYSTQDFDRLEVLDQMTIKHEHVVMEEENNKQPVFLYFLLFFLVAALIGITYVYLNPSVLEVDLKKLDCTMTGYDKKLELYYQSDLVVKFDKKDELVGVNREDIYKFKTLEEYQAFKDNNQESYFNIEGSYKYDDDNMQLKLIYDENLIIYEYKEVYNYLKNKGFSCVEGIYHE